MNLNNLKSIFSANGCNKIYIKNLAPNDNSKNQVYFGGNFEVLNILPISEITTEAAGEWKKERFKAKINFSWILEDGTLTLAPKSQLILYPKYPEVRFSGFLIGSKNAPSHLMTQRLQNRLLFLGVSDLGQILGYVAAPDSEIASELNNLPSLNNYGIFKIIELPIFQNNKQKLITELLRIHNLGWIKSKRLDALGNILPCESSNCGGYTLEAELGITPNGYSEPDYLGWEVKQFGVANFARINSRVITLMTPEPTDGFYKLAGAEAFLRKYGYPDVSGKPDRLNFGGVHKSDLLHPRTNLTLKLIGYDQTEGKIRNANGRIALIDVNNNETASWSFSSMLLHWNRKHNQACYVPSLSETGTGRNYKYGNKIILGTGTDFLMFLKEMANGNIYYDPGIKIENMSSKPSIKKRSQFRIKSGYLSNLYKENEIIDITI
ncbi:MvaI/BcnI restriction endonuclease family protein [Flavobacterium sp. SH_e]|uniref:MvaI/BcnI restriction endonuclease family protein n=1 Tax=Flavobacterium sp. SH_e TaxID=2983767 RepID=UPI0021E4021A|nr:MvaI/BcnI restriction endonuclease family protein [Flavobacterium sp. SH_e]MCV2485941.1 MvaI/BcnI restriction endonuclease family protein [Flavobacterium sp. SH_e]